MSRTNPELVSPAGVSSFAKLKAAARASGKRVDQVAMRFALEGAIRRIFQSDHADRFGMTTSLKGGSLMFFSEGVDPIHGRGTSDIDLQISGFQGDLDDLAAVLRQVLADVPSVDDGVRFDVEGLKVSSIREGGVPGGKVTTTVQIGSAVINFRCDIGFYDRELKDTLVEVDYPSMLPGLEPVRIYRQPIEYSIADKVHAGYQHAVGNTRLRDFYDLWVYLTKCTVDDDRLREAFQRSWRLFGTPLPDSIDAIRSYGAGFVERNSAAWIDLRDQSAWAVPVPELADVVALIRRRLEPVLMAGSLHRPAA